MRHCVAPANIRMIVFNGYEQDIEVVINGRKKRIKKGACEELRTHHTEQYFVFPDRSFTTTLRKGTHLVSYGDANALTVKELVYDSYPFIKQYGFHVNKTVQNQIYKLPSDKVRVFFPDLQVPNRVREKIGDDYRYFRLGRSKEIK